MGSPSAPCLFVRAKDLLLSAAGGYVGCMTAAPGAQFEIKVDGIVRSHRDERDTAIEAARFLQQRNPSARITVTDLCDGSAVPFDRAA
jgi:hypothetical protein